MLNKQILFRTTILLFSILFCLNTLEAKKKKDESKSDSLKSSTFSGIKWRSIGPAFASGRIADFAVNPENTAEYFVAVASGHIGKLPSPEQHLNLFSITMVFIQLVHWPWIQIIRM